MNNEVEIFKPGIAELKTLALKFKGLEIKGVEDEAGYLQVKDARKELGDMRILITKTGKSAREEARKYASSVIEQEKEYLLVITPLEDELKAKIEAIDEAKKKAERIILLPSRKAMLAEIGAEMTDDEILALDEKKFSEMYTAKKMEHLEAQERKRKEEEDAKRHTEELEKAKEEAAEQARIEAEEKSRKEIEKIKREQEEKDRKAKEDEDRKKQEEEDKIKLEKEEQIKTEKNRRYKAWLAENGYNKETQDDFVVKIGDPIIPNGKKTCILFKKVAEITI
jgi:hypothetical protein